MDTETLQKINSFKPYGSHPDYTEGDVTVFDVLASNNLLHGSMFKWDIPSLVKMQQQYAGKPLMFDHEWENVGNQNAFVYDAQLLHYPQPSLDVQNYYLNQSPYPDIDQQIISTEGIYQLICSIATETSHPITNELMYGRKINVSIGGLADGSMICPVCNTGFDDENCPHLIPGYSEASPYYAMAPYWIRSGYQQTLELSMVMAGNCPSARVLNCQMAQVLSLV